MEESYRQYIPDAGVSLERNTPKVPNDNRYYLLQNDRIVDVFPSLRKAQIRFKELLRETGFEVRPRPAAEVDIARLAIERYLDAKEEYWATSHKYRSGGRLMNR